MASDFSIFDRVYPIVNDPLNTYSMDELINIVSYNISAFSDGSNNYNLTLGGSSNIILEGSNMMHIITSSNGVDFSIYNSDGVTRADDKYMTINSEVIGDLQTTKFDSVDKVLFNYNDMFTFTSNVTIQKDLSVVGSSTFNGDVIMTSSLLVNGNIMTDSHLRVTQSIFGSNLNVIKRNADVGSNTVGYGLQINDFNQLEIIKTIVDGSNATRSKRVAVFGIGDISMSDTDDANYLVFSELEGLGIGSGGSNGSVNFTAGSYLPLNGGTMAGNIDMNNYALSNAGSVSSKVFETVGADYAEYMVKEDPNESFVSGQVVGVTQEGQLTSVFDRSIRFMVVSDDFGIIGNNKYGNKDSTETVAFCGRVKVSMLDHPYTVGDYLVPIKSDTGGIKVAAQSKDALSIKDYIISVGQIINIESGTPEIIVKT